MSDNPSASALVGGAALAKMAAQPTAYQLCIDDPLYFRRSDILALTLARLKRHWIQMDIHCVRCEKETVFCTTHRSVTAGVQPDDSAYGNFSVTLHCRRCGYEYLFVFNFEDGELQKIGQKPALADISGAGLSKYKPLLRDGYFGELTRANGLISHGIGIGAFVYLRRIFEKLITDHRLEFETQNGPIEGFDGMRMDEKIGALKKVLPPALVKHRATYGILSAGIHSLDEATCKAYFPAVKAAIMQILEQDFEARERRRNEADLEKEIATIAQTLKGA